MKNIIDKEPTLKTLPIKFNGMEYKNLKLLDFCQGNSIKFVIIKTVNNRINQIVHTPTQNQSSYPKEYCIEDIKIGLVGMCFKDIACKICRKKYSAIFFGETEIGPCCPFCIKRMDPPIEFQELNDIEKYTLSRNEINNPTIPGFKENN